MIRRLRIPGRDRRRRAATVEQRDRLAELAHQAGLAETPAVAWHEDTASAIEHLEAYLQPQLDGMDGVR